MTQQPLQRWIPQDTFGDRLRRIRRELKLSQAEFAEKIGEGVKSVGAWEIGLREPRGAVALAKRIELAYGVPAAWLLGLETELPSGPDDGPGGQGSVHTVVTRLGAGRSSRAEDSFGGGADRTNREAA